MPDFNFSESTITLDEWNDLDEAVRRDGPVPRVLVVQSSSRVENLPRELAWFERVIVTNSDFNDGRIFSIGRQLRLLEFDGQLSFVGDILPDQYLALIACGYDDALNLDFDSIDKTIDLDHTCALASLHQEMCRENAAIFNPGIKL